MKNGKPSPAQNRSVQATAAPLTVPNPVASRDEIENLAYTIYEARGREPGRDLEHWLEAESTLCGTGLSPEPSDSPQV